MDPGRKWDEQDIYQGEIEEAPRAARRGNPLLLVTAALLLAAGWGAWMLHQRAEARRAAVLAALEARAAGTPAAGDEAAALTPDPEARPAPIPPAPFSGRRRFYGVVFDFATKKPVSGALVNLVIAADHSAVNFGPCPTSLNGHYICDTGDRFDGLAVQVSTRGYQGQLEDFYPSLLKRSEAERRALLEERDGYREPARLTFVASQELVRLDLAVVPAGWAAAAQSQR